MARRVMAMAWPLGNFQLQGGSAAEQIQFVVRYYMPGKAWLLSNSAGCFWPVVHCNVWCNQ